ncbi:unnamed protein product [Gongylonema pulchrum]|uniref:Secreted protein n=1 Tax=Gongylonema pulchrum TaxID=637853 RepID=A0A183CZ03_9BILA|nr:unnamed protein product [Gongylonema pulchrum]
MLALRNTFLVVNIITAMSAQANSEPSPELAQPNSQDLKSRRIIQEMSMARIQNQQSDQSGDSLLDEQLKAFEETYSNDMDEIAMKENGLFSKLLLPPPSKKSGTTSRLCGTKLVEAIVKLCNGCVKPAGGKAVTAKRCKFHSYSRPHLD